MFILTCWTELDLAMNGKFEDSNMYIIEIEEEYVFKHDIIPFWIFRIKKFSFITFQSDSSAREYKKRSLSSNLQRRNH
jgi:hypothetical protein